MNIATTKKLTSVGISIPDSLPFLNKRAFVMFPIMLFGVFAATLALPATRAATIWTLNENHPVEMLTFLALIIGGGYGLILARRLHKKGEKTGYVLFYGLFSIGLLLTGMEEIAWGQQLWGFATPESLKAVNMQGETTIHNIRGFHGHTEIFRFIFGFGGLIGILFTKYSKLTKISVPLILFSWFAVITGHATVDVFDDIVAMPKFMEAATSELAEITELLIGISGLLYLYLNSKQFGPGKKQTDKATPVPTLENTLSRL